MRDGGRLSARGADFDEVLVSVSELALFDQLPQRAAELRELFLGQLHFLGDDLRLDRPIGGALDILQQLGLNVVFRHETVFRKTWRPALARRAQAAGGR